MKNRMIFFGKLSFLVWFFCSAAEAMRLEIGSLAEITTSPVHQAEGYGHSFAVSGDVAAWLDNRDWQWMPPQIYGVNLSDPSHLEFAIDLNVPYWSQLAMSGSRVAFAGWDIPDSQCRLRVTDISSQSSPFTFPVAVQIPDVSSLTLDISGSLVAYCGRDPANQNRETFYAAEVSDPDNILHYPICVLPDGGGVLDLVLDGNFLIWSSQDYQNSFVQMADLTNLAQPAVFTVQLPEGIVFSAIDVSGSWLVARCSQGIVGVHNYRDIDNWDIQVLWRDGENGEFLWSGPQIDGPIAIWVTKTGWPSSMSKGNGLLSEPQYRLKAACLMGNGGFTLSTLLTDTNEIIAAHLSGRQVVWSQWTSVVDLYKASIELECGDWGYKSGDLDRDCKVDLRDFAILAQDWLKCTVPYEDGCEFGL